MVKYFVVIGSIAIAVLVASVQSVAAVGVSVKPSALSGAAVIGQDLPLNILVANVTNEPALYQVSLAAPDSAIILQPTDFRLEAGANQLVSVAIKSWLSGAHTNFVQVVGRSLGGAGLAASPGVRIPLTVTVSLGLIGWLAIGVLLLSCGVGAYLFLHFKIINRK